MHWTPLPFSRKHKGKPLPQILFCDPDWFFWAWEQRAFDNWPAVRREAAIIHSKATSICVPQAGPEKRVVEYKFFYSDYTSVGFDLVPESQPSHEGSTPTARAAFIDMSVPRKQKSYDKLGYNIFLRSLKYHLFGDESHRMTAKRCADFFDNESHFLRNA